MGGGTQPTDSKFVKYRYCFSQNGNLYQAFSTQLTNDSSIIISIRADDRFNGLAAVTGESLIKFGVSAAEDRITVHPSVGRAGVSITHNTRVAGRHITAKLLVDATVETLISVPLTKFKVASGSLLLVSLMMPMDIRLYSGVLRMLITHSYYIP